MNRSRFSLILVLCIIFIGPLVVRAAEESGDEFVYASLLNRQFRLEKAIADLSQLSNLSPEERADKADKFQTELKAVKEKLSGHFPAADIALGETVSAIQQHGSAWFLRYLTHGVYTGRKAEHHKPLEAVEIQSRNPDLAGRAALPLLGYPLMVILSYDAVSREAYREFIPQMEEIVREMERRGGKPYEFWDNKPAVIPNDLGWDVDRFWTFAQQCAGKVVNKYFWRSSPEEIRQATNLVSLIIVTSLLNNVTIDLDGDKEAQSKHAFWRANAAPWFTPDKTSFRNKFHIFHFFTHGWLTFLKLFNDTRYDGHILNSHEALSPTRCMLKNAFLFSDVAGIGYEAISSVAGTKHGFLETTSVQELPKPLKKVAQAFHLKNIIIYESMRDLKDNHEGAWFGSALFLSNSQLKLSEISRHREIVEAWQASLKDGDKAVEPESGGPREGKTELISSDCISLYDLNAPTGKQRIDSGFFNEVYRGTGSFDAAGHAAAEVQAFKNLLGDDVMSFNLRKLYGACLASFQDPSRAYREARIRHAGMIGQQFETDESQHRPSIFRDLFANEGGNNADDYNHEADYIYATHRADIAGCYGPIVLTIREKIHRGLDLNQIADTFKYYSKVRLLKNAISLRWKTMLGDYVLDRDEYLLPSYLSSSDIVGFVARSPKAMVINRHVTAADKDFSIALKAPPVIRSYVKQMVGGYLVRDVFDVKNALINRFSESPENTPLDEKVQRSADTIPEPIQIAWNDYLRRINR
ncbi:MAG: hypothetical protein HQM09_19275 [Candidatus Riflebacteria bacterium]|nr:hypothetical protein [Candidatus Riflebacteria bacterium]